MPAQCLSTLGPCDTVCDICKESYETYLKRIQEKQLQEAIQLIPVLQKAGYTVNPPEKT